MWHLCSGWSSSSHVDHRTRNFATDFKNPLISGTYNADSENTSCVSMENCESEINQDCESQGGYSYNPETSYEQLNINSESEKSSSETDSASVSSITYCETKRENFFSCECKCNFLNENIFKIPSIDRIEIGDRVIVNDSHDRNIDHLMEKLQSIELSESLAATEDKSVVSSHISPDIGPGGGSREILPSGGYAVYQHQQQQQQASSTVGHHEFSQRLSNSQPQSQLTPLRSQSSKLVDEKNFSLCTTASPAPPPVLLRGCPTPSKAVTAPTSQTPLPGKSADTSVESVVEQLVPERDTNTSASGIAKGFSAADLCGSPGNHDMKRVAATEDTAAMVRNFKLQHHQPQQQQQHQQHKLAVQGNISNSAMCRQQTISGSATGTPVARTMGMGGTSHLHHHLSIEELRLVQRRQDSNGSSSDDGARSSGHASMSDGHLSSSPSSERHQHYRSPLNSVPEDERLSASVMPNQSRTNRKATHNRSRHRATPAKLVPAGSGLEDIKLAIQQLTMRSHTSNTGYSTSTYSSLSGSESSEPAVRRLMRHSSLETINTNVTSADEFVWVDSHNRLVELQHLPWSNHDVLKVIQNGRLKEHMERVSMETVPRLSYLLQRALVRIGREAQRLSRPLGMCSKQEVNSALRITLCPALADSCTKACLRAAAMFAVSGDSQLKQSKSCRAGLQLSVGKFQRWMADVRLGKFIHEYAAVYLAAGIENLLEEIILQCLPNECDTILSATMFEHAIANNGDLWGLLQPYAHLNAGRIASGALAMPRWPSVSSVGSDATQVSGKSVEQSLLTTCVGSAQELTELLARTAGSRPLTWTPAAIQALFYFMRCSQLEHAEYSAPIQELVYERAYVVLPPLVEWLRVASAHADHRHALHVDHDDVFQAARLLLPGVDCPVRQIGIEEAVCSKRHCDEQDCVRKLKTDLAFKMLSSGRSDLIPHALQLLPANKKLNSVNEHGMTPLMIAVIAHDETCVRNLLDAGADPDIETPPHGSTNCPAVHAETQHWTALTYAALQGDCNIARLLLERGANVEGGARLSEDKCTLTPLQVSVASGHAEMVALLLSHGAHTFLSTLLKDTLCYSGAAHRGCYSAISVAAAHGQRSTLHKLLSHPLDANNKEVLSLEEILAEGANQLTADRRQCGRLQVSCSSTPEASGCSSNSESAQPLKLSKPQVKSLQEAMYHSAENNHLDITLDLRNLGIPWTLHCWMHTLATAHEQRLDSVIDQLLQDFLQVWPDDYSTQFVDECLPLLFNIFRFSKNEGTILLLADIFSTCYGWEAIKAIRDTSFSGGTRIDPKFVNNPELSDVQFRVEGRVFYGHKIVLVTWSPRFRAMLSSKLCDGNPPVVHINDIRYHIFQLVMQYLYHGGCEGLRVEPADVLELMAAANFFQLDGLLRFCEAQCSGMVDLDNIVSMYIHAKVYNASELLEYCQGFLLQNMVALLTYDDSVKRLLFGKKLHSHDVLAGLLLTLQARIKARNMSASPQRPKAK
ncbi:ankyrin repeat and BTB/POZ domain-containing protein 2 isoform X2 [Schistocerca cancellata]|uniref:ankyrin repeat and BTB/POZ domain-containing protein 2 isoform X2 n=1 Tax=Schistocerca cancellata TaxID=274614 RepID=UPI0021182A4C|nr:ankyrin repeat and BTB/POZ domain-containing protein 2 isoform X2 [Schistocerca cancellata]